MKISAIEQRSFARNYIDGVFKVTEFTFHVSAITRQIVNSGTLMMSSDRGTTKRIMNFVDRNDNTIQNGNNILADAEKVIVVYQFLDLPDIKPMRREYEITDRENSSVTYIVDDEILNVGNTRLVQHVYIKYAQGHSLDVGAASAQIQTSFIDTGESGLGGLNSMFIKAAEELFDFSIEGV